MSEIPTSSHPAPERGPSALRIVLAGAALIVLGLILRQVVGERLPHDRSGILDDSARVDAFADAFNDAPRFGDEPELPDSLITVPLDQGPAPPIDSTRPSFTPMSVAPELRNADDVERVLDQLYPEDLRAAGVGGRAFVWLFIDVHGDVRVTQLSRSSGHPQLDDAALIVAATMHFTPARHGPRTVPVWIELPVDFRAP